MVTNEGSITRLVKNIEVGNDLAAAELWNRYCQQLVQLARQRLPRSMCRVSDEEDIALSAFAGFAVGLKAGQFPDVESRDDLARVLFAITKNKLRDHLKHELRAKRGGGKVRGESAFAHAGLNDEGGGIDEAATTDSTPSFTASAVEEFNALLDELGEEPRLREIALLKLEGHNNVEIAVKLGCVRRTIERKLERIRAIWEHSEPD